MVKKLSRLKQRYYWSVNLLLRQISTQISFIVIFCEPFIFPDIELVKSSSFPCVSAGMTRNSPAGWPATLLSAFFEFHISTKSIKF